MLRFSILSLFCAVALVAVGCATTGRPVSKAPGAADLELIKPAPLQPGDVIQFVAPAKWRLEQPTLNAQRYLEDLGYLVRMDRNLHTRNKYLAGTDEERAQLLMDAFTDPNVDAIFPVTGGYGSTRILDLLDYDVIRQNPKVLIGYSDITALHLAILQRSGVVTFHTSFPTYMYGSDDIRTYADRHLWNMIGAYSYAGGRELPYEPHFDVSDLNLPVETVVGGTAEGFLTGGNLTLISVTMGTPYEIDTRGALLFLEDVGESPYRIDRMFQQLQSAGKLDDVAGVILGVWRNCDTDNPEENFTLREVVEQYFAHRDYPVVYHFPVGHVRQNGAFPMGVRAELDADAGTLRLLESPVRLR